MFETYKEKLDFLEQNGIKFEFSDQTKNLFHTKISYKGKTFAKGYMNDMFIENFIELLYSLFHVMKGEEK